MACVCGKEGKNVEPVISFDEIDEKGPQQYEATLEVSAKEVDRPEVTSPTSVRIQAEARRGEQPSEYEVDGAVKFTSDLECARCTDPSPFAAETSFTVRYRPLTIVSELSPEVEVSPDELDVEYIEERQVALRRIATEQIQLALPMKPLCDDACQGLCPTCGSNRNRETCTCETSTIDPRWEGLSALRDQLEKKKQN